MIFLVRSRPLADEQDVEMEVDTLVVAVAVIRPSGGASLDVTSPLGIPDRFSLVFKAELAGDR